ATDGTQIGHISQFRTSFIPHINEAANTISLELNIAENEGITSFNAKKRLTNIDPTIWFHDQLNPPLAVNLNVNDNQTILISGLNEKHEDIAIFVTTRIVRRAE